MSNDPLGNAGAPSMSFDGVAEGTVKTIDVSEPGEQVQQRVFGTGDLAFWPPNNDGSPGKPKMAVVYNGADENGEDIALWVPLPSDLKAKVVAAQTAYGRQIGTGSTVDRVYVKFTGTAPGKTPGYKKNVYAVKIEDTGQSKQASKPDPIGEDPWAAAPAGDEPPF